MKIAKVVYELYKSDYSCIKGNEDSDEHEIDREVCLELDNGRKMYVSWANEPIQFSVGYKEGRWNESEPDIVVEASQWKMWSALVGQSCELIYQDEEHQVLELRSKDHSIYFSSQEQGCWASDVLHISVSKPAYSS